MTKVLTLLAKLKQHQESAQSLGSEAEAQAFAEKIQRLLTEHKLSMTDVEYAALDKEEPVGYHEQSRRDLEQEGVRIRRCRVEWIELIAQGIGYGHFVQHVVHTGSSKISFVGREADCQIASYMLMLFIRTAEKLSQQAYVKYFYECRANGNVTEARGFKPAWLEGFAHRLMTRYYNETKRLRDDQAQNLGAIVRLDSSKLAIKSFFENDERFEPAGTLGGRDADNDEGRRQGTEAANRQSLKSNAMPAGKDQRRLA